MYADLHFVVENTE